MTGFKIIQHLNPICPRSLITVSRDATVTIPCESEVTESEPKPIPKIEVVLRDLPQPVQQQEFRPKPQKIIPPKVLRK